MPTNLLMTGWFAGRLLYKCPNAQCGFQAPNASLLKDHLPSCQFTTDSKSFGCPHCDKRVKAVVNLMEHLKTHGQQKQICSLCTYKTWATSELTRHMKVLRSSLQDLSSHKIIHGRFSYLFVPVLPQSLQP